MANFSLVDVVFPWELVDFAECPREIPSKITLHTFDIATYDLFNDLPTLFKDILLTNFGYRLGFCGKISKIAGIFAFKERSKVYNISL